MAHPAPEYNHTADGHGSPVHNQCRALSHPWGACRLFLQEWSNRIYHAEPCSPAKQFDTALLQWLARPWLGLSWNSDHLLVASHYTAATLGPLRHSTPNTLADPSRVTVESGVTPIAPSHRSYGTTTISGNARVIQGDVAQLHNHINSNTNTISSSLLNFVTFAFSRTTHSSSSAQPPTPYSINYLVQGFSSIVLSAATVVVLTRQSSILRKCFQVHTRSHGTGNVPFRSCRAVNAPKLGVLFGRHVWTFARAFRGR